MNDGMSTTNHGTAPTVQFLGITYLSQITKSKEEQEALQQKEEPKFEHLIQALALVRRSETNGTEETMVG